MKRLPPYGAELSARLRYGNLPKWVVVFAGRNAWNRAKNPLVKVGDCHPLVWDSGEYRWPVSRCQVLVEIDTGPSIEQMRGLVGDVLVAGATAVLAWWLNWGESRPIAYDRSGRGRYLTADEINAALWPGRLNNAA